jgi:hypothetical protein
LAVVAYPLTMPGGPGAEDPARALFPMEEFQIPDSIPAKVQEKVRKEILPGILREMDPWPAIPSQEVQDKMSDAAAMAYREKPTPPATVCSDSLQSGQRLMLTAFVAEGFHGSTALQQALMSAKNVGTLCAGDNWECEVVGDKRRCELCNAFDRPASALPCIACAAAPHSVANGTEAFRSDLELFEPYWMAQPTKPVLVVKWAPIWPGTASWDMLATSDWGKPGGGVAPTPGFDLEEIETATVPRGMAASGVNRVSWGVIIMHRPWCMWNMSSHARNSRERDLKVWAVRELFLTEKLIAYHRKLAYDHVPALVTNYAQLLWRPDDFVMRVRFSPGHAATSTLPLPAHTTGAHTCARMHAGEALCAVRRQCRPQLRAKTRRGRFRGEYAQD